VSDTVKSKGVEINQLWLLSKAGKKYLQKTYQGIIGLSELNLDGDTAYINGIPSESTVYVSGKPHSRLVAELDVKFLERKLFPL